MIPKIIHYCWFGKGVKSSETEMFISRWKSILSDYEFMEWNESNFDVDSCRYSREAYKLCNYAHVSDVCRLYALMNFGGIYMDTDVELIKTFDEFLNLEVFMGLEGKRVGTNVIGASPEHPFVRQFYNYYLKHSFISFLGHPKRTPNTSILMKYVLPKTELKNWPTIFPFHYFCCKDYLTGKISKCDYSVAIHHFAASWKKRKTFKSRFKTIMRGLVIKHWEK